MKLKTIRDMLVKKKFPVNSQLKSFLIENLSLILRRKICDNCFHNLQLAFDVHSQNLNSFTSYQRPSWRCSSFKSCDNTSDRMIYFGLSDLHPLPLNRKK